MGWELGRIHGNLKLIETSGDPLDMIILEKVLVTILSQEHILDNDESDINLCGVELLIDVKEKLVSFAFLFYSIAVFLHIMVLITNLLNLTFHFSTGSPIKL